MTGGLRFFISSTSDLTEERRAVKTIILRLHQFVYAYEDDRARGVSPESRLLDVIASSDALIGILGSSYGEPFASSNAGNPAMFGTKRRGRILCRHLRRASPFYRPGEACSIVQWEFHIAWCYRREIMSFLKRPKDVSEYDPLQQAFLDALLGFRTGIWCKHFEETDDLSSLVHDCVLTFANDEMARARSQQKFIRLFGAIAILPCIIDGLVAIAEEVGLISFGSNYGFRYLLLVGVLAPLIWLVMYIYSMAHGNEGKP